MRKSSLKLAAVEISMLVLVLNLQNITASEHRKPETVPEALEISYTYEPQREVPAQKSVPVSEDEAPEDSGYTESERYMLMKLAMAEAEGEDTEGKALVIMVVLNRVQSDEFPDTIEEVILQPGQFSPVAEGGRYYTVEPDEDCQRALDLVLSGWDESRGALYFESFKRESWHSRNLNFLFQHGNHKFYR